MSLTDEQKKLKAISDAEISTIDRNIALFTDGLEKLGIELQRRVVNLIAGEWTVERASAAQSLVDLQKAIQAQLNSVGYVELVRKFMGSYDDAQKFSLQALEAMGITPVRLARIDELALKRLREIDYSYLEGLGPAAVRAVSSGAIQNTLLGVRRAEIIEAVKTTLDAKLKNHACTYADTALVSYDRTSSSKLYIAAGIERFLYRGPLDVKTREFCRQHVGKTYTIDEIRKMKNGLEPPMGQVLIFGGGWNCRHVWAAAPPEKKSARAA